MNSLDIASGYNDRPEHTERHFCASCPICDRILPDSHKDWRLPHPCGFSMHPDEAWVCSDECAKQWLDDKWEYVEEWHLTFSDLNPNAPRACEEF